MLQASFFLIKYAFTKSDLWQDQKGTLLGGRIPIIEVPPNQDLFGLRLHNPNQFWTHLFFRKRKTTIIDFFHTSIFNQYMAKVLFSFYLFCEYLTFLLFSSGLVCMSFYCVVPSLSLKHRGST